MTLWLDGVFWGRAIRQNFVSEIEWMRRSVFQHILPSFPDPEDEGNMAITEALDAAMSGPWEGFEDPSDYAEWARDQGIDTFLGVMRMRQAAVNMATAMLWHLIEQQMIFFHLRQILQNSEEWDVRTHPQTRDRIFNLAEFHRRLDIGGCSMKKLASWSKVHELLLVANVVKHASGKSLDQLCKIRPDLLNPPGPLVSKLPPVQWVDRPAAGEDLFVTDKDLASYFDAAIQLWREFAVAIQAHSETNRKKVEGSS